MDSSQVGVFEVVEGRNWRFVVSVERFRRSWFTEVSAVDVVYHFNPDTKVLVVHFANFVSRMVLVPGGLKPLARGLGGRMVGHSIRLREIEDQEGAQQFAEYLQEFFEENRALSKKNLGTA